MFLKLSVVLLFFVAISVEAKDNCKNSTKWKQHKQKFKVSFLHDVREQKA
jgi:hypothetical protein